MKIGKLLTTMVGIPAIAAMTVYVDANDISVRMGQQMFGEPYVAQVAEEQMNTAEGLYDTHPDTASTEGLHELADTFYTREGKAHHEDILAHNTEYLEDGGIEDALQLFECIPERFQYKVFWRTMTDDIGIGKDRYERLMEYFSQDGGE